MLASVDPPAVQLAMNQTWDLPFRWVSDPDGTALAQPLDAWNANERGGIFHPLVLLIAPDGREVLRHRSRDFADRDDDEDVLAALRGLELAPLEPPPPWAPDGVTARVSDNAFTPERFVPYFRGVRFSSFALAGRMRDPADAEEARQVVRMAESFQEALKQRRGGG